MMFIEWRQSEINRGLYYRNKLENGEIHLNIMLVIFYVLHGLVKSIRSYFKKYALVIVVVKGRAKGISIAEIMFQHELN